MPPPMEFGFEACRLCLAPNNIKKLTSMFAGDGDFAEMYQQLSGVDVSSDQLNERSVLICGSCSDELRKAFEWRETLRYYDEFYFGPRREDPLTAIEMEHEETIFVEALSEAEEIEEKDIAYEVEDDYFPKIVQLKPKSSVAKKSTGPTKELRFQCDICSKTYNHKCTLRVHYDRVHLKVRNYTCDYCNRSFNGKNEITNHMTRNHLTYRPFKCEFENCCKYFQTNYLRNEHEKKGHKHGAKSNRINESASQNSFKSKRIIERKSVSTKSFQCDFENSFAKKPENVTRVRRIDPEKTLKCDFEDCEKYFKSKVYLNRHKREFHLRARIECRLCEKTFLNNRNLSKHIEQVHQKLKNFICEYCNKSFYHKNNYTHHMERVHLIDAKRFICDFGDCLKYFKTKQDVNIHMKNVHEEPLIQCKPCGKWLKKDSFRKHTLNFCQWKNTQ